MMSDQENKEQARKLAQFHDKHHPQRQPTWLRGEAEAAEKAALTSLHFEERSGGGICISNSREKQLNLTADETFLLWQWLSAHKDFFQGKRLEIHLYQEDLGHLDELKTAIPDAHERGPIVKVLDAQWDAVSERALQLLKDFQIEYLIHPMLEEQDTYEQG
ncbi:MAG TPA: hypothetical protein VKR06_10595 [Ktedonosporobacter sp.]|nr:hypothetical protein [Ktedonosporobacter sp.]